MTRDEVLTKIARDKLVEKTITNIAKDNSEDLRELAQDIYEDLCKKPEEKIVEMYEKKQLNFFITRIVLNNIKSVNSRYYTRYVKYNNKNILVPQVFDYDYDYEDNGYFG